SPVAWSHYYVLWLPSLLFVPLWLVRRGHRRAARAVAIVPAGLIWVHYLAKPWFGQFGLLGLGTLLWFLAVVTLSILIRSSGRFVRRVREREKRIIGVSSFFGEKRTDTNNPFVVA